MPSDQIVDIIKAISPDHWVGVIVLLLIFFLCYKIGSWNGKIKGFDGENAKLSTKMGSVETLVHEVRGTINSISSRLGEMELTFSKKAAHSSPLRLTDSGNDLLSSTVGPILDAQWSNLKIKFPKLETLTNPFDIENYAQEIAPLFYQNHTTPVQKDQIKTEIYKQGLSMEAFMPVIWITIRDKALIEKGISIQE